MFVFGCYLFGLVVLGFQVIHLVHILLVHLARGLLSVLKNIEDPLLLTYILYYSNTQWSDCNQTWSSVNFTAKFSIYIELEVVKRIKVPRQNRISTRLTRPAMLSSPPFKTREPTWTWY